MIKSEPFVSLDGAREAATEAANEQGKRQYIVKIKTNYFFTDDEPQKSGVAGWYRLEEVVEPED